MSGPFGSPQWMYSSGFYPHEIGNSARLNDGDFYSRTPSSSSNADTFTWSAWVKNCVTAGGYLLSSGVASTREFLIYFDSGNSRLNVYQYNGGIDIQVITSMKFRDPSAWYHIVVAYDSPQSTASDRIKIYVNGEQQTDFATANYPAQGLGSRIGTTDVQDIGKNAYNQNVYSDFYITEVNYISGSALTPASFGETKADTWIPKKYTGSYGSHDYYLDFATRATDPIDASGQGNNWTDTNVVATDWMIDSPTNNWATLTSIGPRNAHYGGPTLTQGNLTATSTSTSDWSDSESTLFNHGDSGKWYYEVRMDSLDFGNSSGYVQFNIGGAYVWRYYGNSNTLISTGGSFTSLADGDIVMLAVDQDNGKGYFGINGGWYNVSGAPDPAAGTNPHTTFTSIDKIGQVQIRSGSAANTVTINFGQDSSFAGQATAQGNTDANGRGDFYYAPPAGFLALCSANLPDPVAAINPAVNNSPQDHFNTVLYTGNDSDPRSITGVGFQPDWVWIKARSAAYSHVLYDVLRGTGTSKALMANVTSPENTYPEYHNISSFDSDGFTIGVTSDNNVLNDNGVTNVAWNWKAGGSGSSNSDGTITSTVSANTDVGFSVVTYDGSSTGTVGHGLSSAPHIVIIKSRDASSGGYWWTGTTIIDGSMDYFQLNDNNAKADSGYSVPTSTVFSNVTFTGSTNQVAYCFQNVEGFSKIGTYTGNGDADGPCINTGFRPAFVMIKRTDATDDWRMYDNKRSNYNDKTATLYANHALAEYTSAGANEIDTLSNGFKIRNTNNGYNADGGTYLYIAFAEMPFKYANAR